MFYTVDDDGLSQPWHGRVFLNPPYANRLITAFSSKLVDEYERGRVDQAVVLTNNATETRWFRQLADVASAMCFPTGRTRFWHPERESPAPLQGQAVTYLGPRQDAFAIEFGELGFVVSALRALTLVQAAAS
jgi:hypothetical protein